jgi:hypothetical protein
MAAFADLGLTAIPSTEHNAVQSLPEFASLVDLDLAVVPSTTAFTYGNHLMTTTYGLMPPITPLSTSESNSMETACIDFSNTSNLEAPSTNIALGISPVFTVVSLQPSSSLDAAATSANGWRPTRHSLPANLAAPSLTMSLVSAISIDPHPDLKASARLEQQIQAKFSEHSDRPPVSAEVQTSLPNSKDNLECGKLNERLANVKEHDTVDQEMQDVAAILVALPSARTKTVLGETMEKSSGGFPNQSSAAHSYKETQPPAQVHTSSSQRNIATVEAPASGTIDNPVLVDSDNETRDKYKPPRTGARSRKRRQTADGVVRWTEPAFETRYAARTDDLYALVISTWIEVRDLAPLEGVKIIKRFDKSVKAFQARSEADGTIHLDDVVKMEKQYRLTSKAALRELVTCEDKKLVRRLREILDQLCQSTQITELIADHPMEDNDRDKDYVPKGSEVNIGQGMHYVHQDSDSNCSKRQRRI